MRYALPILGAAALAVLGLRWLGRRELRSAELRRGLWCRSPWPGLEVRLRPPTDLDVCVFRDNLERHRRVMIRLPEGRELPTEDAIEVNRQTILQCVTGLRVRIENFPTGELTCSGDEAAEDARAVVRALLDTDMRDLMALLRSVKQVEAMATDEVLRRAGIRP